VRGAGTALATLMLLAVVVRAASSVRGERDRNTLDDLLTTPLSNREILLGKWLGAVLSVRRGWAWLGLIWAVGLATGSVQVYGLVVVAVCWLVYAAVGAGVGLWFSVGSKTTLRATLSALGVMTFLGGGHWLLSELVCYPALRWLVPRHDQVWLHEMEVGLTPPFLMGFFAYHRHDLTYDSQTERFLKRLPALLSGVACWAALVPLLWVLVKRRFERMTGRLARTAPERAARRQPRRARPANVPVRAVEPLPITGGYRDLHQ
jgi:hypothetical protein